MKAKIDFTLDGKFYECDAEIPLKGLNYEQIIALNEKGFIYPLETKELFKIKNNLQNSEKNILKKEENKHGDID